MYISPLLSWFTSAQEAKQQGRREMVHYQRYHQMKKCGDEEEAQTLVLECGISTYFKRTRPKFLPPLFLFSLVSCSLLLLLLIFSSSSTISLLYPSEEHNGPPSHKEADGPPCSAIPSGSIFCDRSAFRFDICFMKGDIRTQSASSSIFLYSSNNDTSSHSYPMASLEEEEELQHEKIKPYTRKWETSIMDTIPELDLIMKKYKFGGRHECEVQHSVPAIFFSTGGYTGNVYHDFNDGIIPLYITSQHFKKKVVFVMLEYHKWYMSKYGDILSRLSDYPPIDFNGDQRTHCFPEAIVGLRIHNELTVDSSQMQGNKSILDFRNLLDQAYRPRIKELIRGLGGEAQLKFKKRLSLSPSPLSSEVEEQKQEEEGKKPKLVIILRKGSRRIVNEDAMIKLAEEIGFHVQVLRPSRTTELAKIYRALNSSDALLGVHGAAMTHLLFMRPGSVFIQVIPLGIDWAAETYYGEPAMKLGLKYVGYKILPRESSLYRKYHKEDPVLRDPKSITSKGWEFTKKVYLDGQNVMLDLSRFGKRLVCAYNYISKKNQGHQWQPQ
ncbi:PREDICTED: uncharacterized protein LOC104606300 [Nelumbo nucifera]|uniref:Glycosyltransferase 61 catalytic domain-containing protein n=2 Tax=Nelumbo nucifera TaxID=4432 RepID=A0A822YJS7_NELNU|nr:PREDICTED: uncharacterized protein LOC104606300 [Nelumbo nucifera]DAD29618.1 TPA_asm: hypothetical protein HUJ06_031086 [Nelumbo nucifera]